MSHNDDLLIIGDYNLLNIRWFNDGLMKWMVLYNTLQGHCSKIQQADTLHTLMNLIYIKKTSFLLSGVF